MRIIKIITPLLVLAILPLQASAREYYFFGTHLAPPPAQGSAEYDQDFLRLHELQDHRTSEDCALAQTQSKFSFENTFGPSTGVLTKSEMNRARLLAWNVMARVATATFYFKKKFGRPRPYQTDTTLVPCISMPDGERAYPSGHSATGYALALAMARKFPYKKDLILAQGLQVGENRLVGGVHHPSDVVAGRKLAAQIVNRMRIRSVRR